MTNEEDEKDFLRLDRVDFHAFQAHEPAKSIVVKVSGVFNDRKIPNFFMWSRVMTLKSSVEEAKVLV